MRTRAAADLRIVALCSALTAFACATPSAGLAPVLETPELPESGPLLLVLPVHDARVFSTSSHPSPKPSVRGDPKDGALTSRIVGRRLLSSGLLGPNKILEPGVTASDLVESALVAGLRKSGLRATLRSGDAEADAAALPVEATVLDLWLYRRQFSALGTISYLASVDVRGEIPGDRGPALLQIRGSVSAGGVDNRLWRRAIETAMQEISSALTRRIRPLPDSGQDAE
jgi:hypothetical protein